MNQERKKVSVKQAFLWIFISFLLLSGTASLAFFFYKRCQKIWGESPVYVIHKIEALNQQIPQEVLEQIVDVKGKNLYRLNLLDLKRKAERVGFIQEILFEKKYPDTLVVRYELKKSVAKVFGSSDLLVDQEGNFFDGKFHGLHKNLPQIVFGKKGQDFEKRKKLALKIIEKVPDLSLVDVSRAYSKSLGKREIVVLVMDQKNKKLLRLTTSGWEREFDSFSRLNSKLKFGPTFDFRIPGVVLVENGSTKYKEKP
jgi:cell division septal protein FtsQ